MDAKELTKIILGIIEKAEKLELEADLSEADKIKISKWVTGLVVDAYIKGMKGGILL